MATATPATEKQPEATPAPPLPLDRIVKPEFVQAEEQVIRRRFITLPSGSSFDDLGNRPEIWRMVQQGSDPLAFLDHLVIVDDQGSWMAHAVVAAADGQGVSLADLRRSSLPERTSALPQIETHRIAYRGKGYVVVDKRTNHPVPGTVCYFSLASAIMELHRMAPRRPT